MGSRNDNPFPKFVSDLKQKSLKFKCILRKSWEWYQLFNGSQVPYIFIHKQGGLSLTFSKKGFKLLFPSSYESNAHAAYQTSFVIWNESEWLNTDTSPARQSVRGGLLSLRVKIPPSCYLRIACPKKDGLNTWAKIFPFIYKEDQTKEVF